MKYSFPLVIVLGILLTAILTWPFAANIAGYYTDQGDYATHGSIFWWNQDSVKTGRIFNPEEYWHGYMFYPHPYSFAFANTSVFPSLVFAPIFWATGSLPFSLNLYTFLTFVFSFTAAYFFIRYFLAQTFTPGESKPTPGVFAGNLAALVGAFIFTFNPQTMTRFPHHLDILGKYWLPLIFLFGYRFLSRPNWKDAIFLSLFITLNSLTTNYFQIFVLVMLPLVFIPFLVREVRGRNWEYFGRLGKYGAVSLIFLPILLYFNLPFLEFSQKEGAARSIGETVFFSARINDWLAPATNNLLYGEWSKRLEKIREPKDNRGILNYEEHTLFIGIVSSFLFFFGLKHFLKARLVHWFFLLPLVFSFIFTFGPYFPPNDEGQGLKLPFYFLYEVLPFMQGIRSPTRFEYIMLVPFSLIAAYGAIHLGKIFTKHSPRGSLPRLRSGQAGPPPGWFALITLIILILENFTVMDFSERSLVFSQLDDTTLNKLSFLKNHVTLHLPIYTTDDADIFGKNSYATNWAVRTGEKITNGNSGFLPPDSLGFLFEIREKLDRDAFEKLKVLDVDYVIIHKNLLEADDLQGITPNLEFYKKGLVFEDPDLLIIDLSKYSFEARVCDFPRDFKIQVTDVYDFERDRASYALILENREDCFLPSVYRERYRETRLVVSGQERTADYRLPILVGPREQVVVGEVERSLKIK